MNWQVVEKESSGIDWHAVRYNSVALTRFNDKTSALNAAKSYLTSVNCDNALTASEKRSSFEAFMLTDDGIFLGVLDGKDWYLTYQKDIYDKGTSGESKTVKYPKGSRIKDLKHFELDGKTQVDVRPLPGT